MDLEIEVIPRPQFKAFLQRKERWACLVVHRRGGKTFACVQDLGIRALTHERAGPPLRYAYIAPTRDQAKDVAWGYFQEFLGAIPGATTNQSELKVELPNKASIRLYSGDNYERMRGLYFDGVVVDEYADFDPMAWPTVIRPCLSDYGGWATFIGTPKGRNVFHQTYMRAIERDDWFSMMLKASESGLIPAVELEDIIGSTDPDIYKQEYECDFSIAAPGLIYAEALDKQRAAGKVHDDVVHYEGFPVYTAWDIGAPLNTICWVFQLIGDRIKLLECLQGGPECATPAQWAKRLKGRESYQYGGHFLPHDGETQWLAALAEAELKYAMCVPRCTWIWDPINDALASFSRCEFHATACEIGINALEAYRSKQESDGVTIKDVPVHDWASHASKGFECVHAAIKAGMVVDRSAIPSRAKNGKGLTVLTGSRGDTYERTGARGMLRKVRVRR
jgi:hypothetical protein